MIYLIYILLNYHTYWELNNWTPFKPVNVMSLPLTWYASSTHSGIIRQKVCKELMFFLEAHGKHFLWANHILPLLPLPDFQPVLTHSLDVWGFLPALDFLFLPVQFTHHHLPRVQCDRIQYWQPVLDHCPALWLSTSQHWMTRFWLPTPKICVRSRLRKYLYSARSAISILFSYLPVPTSRE